MKTEQILQLVEAVSGFGLDEFEYEEDGVKLKLKKGGHVLHISIGSNDPAGRTKTEAEIARTEENAEVLLEGKIVKAPLVGIFLCVAGRRRQLLSCRQETRVEKGTGSRDRGSDEAYE